MATQYAYTSAFNDLDTITDPLNHVTDFDYDADGCLDKITDGALRSTTFDCNGAGQINSVTDARSKTTGFLVLPRRPEEGDRSTRADDSRFTDAAAGDRRHGPAELRHPLHLRQPEPADEDHRRHRQGHQPSSTTPTATCASSAISGVPRRARPSSPTTTRTSSRPGSIRWGGAKASPTTTTGTCSPGPTGRIR